MSSSVSREQNKKPTSKSPRVNQRGATSGSTNLPTTPDAPPVAGVPTPAGVGRRRKLARGTVAPEPPRTAVILAAGFGTRLQQRAKVKPLLRVGGLSLIERSIRTLGTVGVERFIVVVGASGDVIRDSLRDFAAREGSPIDASQIEFVDSKEFRKGNGLSLADGCEGVEESFFVTMADHVFSADFVREFARKIKRNYGTAQLATDERIDSVFDLDDATKVGVMDGQIFSIGKKLATYDQVDTGLFYFPAGSSEFVVKSARTGRTSVSQIVIDMSTIQGFRAVPVARGIWQDVDDPAMAAEAEKRLLRALIKPTDGPVSRYLNRPVSLWFSRWLARFEVSPNQITTFVTLLTFGAAALALSTAWPLFALAGVLFHLASILDGCDGEVSRLRFVGSRFGAFYDTISDNIRYLAFYGAIGISVYRESHQLTYLWLTLATVVIGGFSCYRMARWVLRTQEHLTNLAVTASFEGMSARRGGIAGGLRTLRVLVKQDVQALGVALLLIVGLREILFVLVAAGSLAVAVAVLMTLRAEKAPEGRLPWRALSGLLGLAALGYVFRELFVAESEGALAALQAFQSLGWALLVPLVVAPMWFAANAMALRSLLGTHVSFTALVYNQVVGEGYNALLPLAGFGGEPFKFAHLRRAVGEGRAGSALVRDRFLQSASGLLFGGAIGFGASALVGTDYRTSLLIASSVAAVLGAALIWLVVQPLPTRLLQWMLRRFGYSDEGELSGPVWAPLFWKMVARAFALVEVAAILYIMGLPATVETVLVVGTMLILSSVMFFFVPQGLGVNEIGIIGAFELLSLPLHLGLTLALVRRLRILVWGAVGVLAHGTGVDRIRWFSASPGSDR